MDTATQWIRRTCAAAALAALLLVAGTGVAEPVELTIVHFNDLDRMDESGGQGGVARLAAVIAAERAARSNVLVTFAGDAISPSLLSGFDQGAHMIELLNRLDLTAMAIGNHEYDFGPEVAKQRFAEAKFPILGANNIDADGEIIDGARASMLAAAGPYQVGIFGLTTLSTAVKSSPGAVTFRPVTEVAAEQSAALRESGADLVIALAHTDAAEDRALLEQGAVDLLLSGDDHRLRVDFSGGVLFAESGEQADWVTVIDLLLDETEQRGGMRFTWSPAFRVINTARVTPDPALAAAAQVYLDRLAADLDVAVGTTATELDSRRATIRGREAAIGNLITDAVRAATGADVAMTNGRRDPRQQGISARHGADRTRRTERTAVRQQDGGVGAYRARPRRRAGKRPQPDRGGRRPLPAFVRNRGAVRPAPARRRTGARRQPRGIGARS